MIEFNSCNHPIIKIDIAVRKMNTLTFLKDKPKKGTFF